MKYLSIIILITAVFTSCKDGVKKNVEKKEDGKIQEIKTYLNERASKDSLHGVVLIGKNDEILLQEAYGYVDLDSLEKHTLETQIGLASLGKMFTAISIMQLESEGRLELEDLASKYLDDIENKTISDSVKIKHLLAHTSGLGSYWAELRASNQDKEADLEYIYSLVKNDSLLKPVGKSFGYSNSGYILLGRIIEEVSGLSYRDYVKKNIFDKCKMFNTELEVSAGGGKSTAADMWKFGQALRKKELLDNDKFESMIQNRSDGDYGYGFMLDNSNDVRSYGHNGGFWKGEKLGIAAYFFTIDNGYTIVVLTNRNPNVGGVGMDLHEILTKKRKLKMK
ncbi:beta-lactamase family protein [Maribacter sp.]|nr:beta-lactamase family protein [Maribacter sp.]